MRLWQRIQHAFAIRRRHKAAQNRVLVQWSQWRSPDELRREVDEQLRLTGLIRCASCRCMMRDVPRHGSCPTCGYSVRRTLQLMERAPQLFAISILGMGGLGMLAILALLMGELIMRPSGPIDVRDLLFTVIVLVPLCFIIGSIVGMFSAPIVVPALRKVELRFALPLVYGGSAIVTLVYLFAPISHPVFYPLDSAAAAYVSVCVLSLVAALTCPKVDVRPPGMCNECGYDLRGNASGVCPECGAGIVRAGSSAEDKSGNW